MTKKHKTTEAFNKSAREEAQKQKVAETFDKSARQESQKPKSS